MQERLIDFDSVIVYAKSGVTGAGKKLSQSTHYIDVDENFSLHKLNQHQHIPEIMQQLKQWALDMGPIQFTTDLLPVKRGLMATIYAKVTADSADVNEIIAAPLQATYMDKLFVKVLANDMPDLRRNPIKPDLGWLVSTKPAHLAGVFTRNTFPEAPVQIDQQVLRRNQPAYAIFVNSANANAFTRATGLVNAYETQKLVANKLHTTPAEVLVVSTGIIGEQLPMEKIRRGVEQLQESDPLNLTKAMLTDRYHNKHGASYARGLSN